MAVSIYDVAKKAGVSVATVSRVINNSMLVSKDTKNNIRNVIKELNYKPYARASKIMKKNLMAAAVLVHDIKNIVYPEVLLGIEEELEKNGYNLFMCNTDKEIKKEKKYLDTLLEKGVDGIIFLGTRPTGLKQQYIINLADKIPVVMINDHMVGSNVYSVMTDEVEGAFQAVNYLIGLGHKRIAFINGDIEYTTYRYKHRGYIRALEANNIKVDEDYHINEVPYIEGGYQGTKKLIKMNKEKPTAIFAASDQMAMGVYKAIYEAGYRIPEDFSIVGFSGIALSGGLFPELTTVDQFAHNTGNQAGRILMRLVAGKNLEQKRILLTPKLIIRESCRGISIDS